MSILEYVQQCFTNLASIVSVRSSHLFFALCIAFLGIAAIDIISELAVTGSNGLIALSMVLTVFLVVVIAVTYITARNPENLCDRERILEMVLKDKNAQREIIGEKTAKEANRLAKMYMKKDSGESKEQDPRLGSHEEQFNADDEGLKL